MSEICLINLKEHRLEFEQLRIFANEIVKFALKKEKGVYFNSLPYDNTLVREAKLNDYFLLTDSFYCDNSEFVSTIGLKNQNVEVFMQDFMSRFDFFNGLIKIIFNFNIEKIEIFISEGMGDHLDEYDEVLTTSQNFLADIFNNILKYKDEMAYEIPNLKLVIQNPQ